MINYFIFGISYAFACVVQPGPFQAFLFSQSIRNGWRKTIPLVFAPLISDLPIIILVLFVLTNVPHIILGILQCFGGIFLLFLAFKAYKTLYTLSKSDKQSISQYGNLFKAVIVNLFNPNPYLGWSLVMGPMLINGWSVSPKNGIALLIGFYSSMIIYSTVMVVLFAAAGNLGQRINRISLGISVIAFVFFGFYQLWSGITGLF
jgi:threonine/homoserine/homoserine lactone efflux protein